AFAAARATVPRLRLVKVGGPWTPEQEVQLNRLDIRAAVTQRTGLSRADIAALYRGAALVLLPSEAEGFGLPVVEPLACGATVLASDLPVLREVGRDAVAYCPVGAVPAWAEAIARLINDPSVAPNRTTRLSRAALFTWEAHAATIVAAYRRLMEG